MRKSKKNSSEPLEIHIDSLVSQKARQNQITYFKSTRKTSLGGMNFWNSAMSFLGRKITFQKWRKFSYFWLCPPAKLPKFEQWVWFSYICCISVTSTQPVLYLISVTSNHRVGGLKCLRPSFLCHILCYPSFYKEKKQSNEKIKQWYPKKCKRKQAQRLE